MKNISLSTSMIAPCGMNCALCMAYQRDKKHCPGCRYTGKDKSPSCTNCIIINCSKLTSKKNGYCFSCESFPCKRLKGLDQRYRQKYDMSFIANLDFIKNNGIRNFIAKEKQKWACSNCGELVCAHRPNCFKCGKEKKIIQDY